MKYLIVLYAEYTDGTASKKAIYEADTEPAALSSFHSYMASYISNKSVKKVICRVIGTDNIDLKSESFVREDE